MEPNQTVPSSPSPIANNTNSSASSAVLESPSSLLKSSWAFFKTNWKILTLIVGLPTAVMTVGQLLTLTGNAVLIVIAVILSIAAAIFSVASSPAAIDTVRTIIKDPSIVITLKGQYKVGFGFFWAVVLVAILQGLVAFGSIVLFVIPGIIVSLYIGMSMFACVLDGKKGLSTLTESYSLVRNRWWAVLGRLVILGLVFIGIYIVYSIIVAGLMFLVNLIIGSSAVVVATLITNLIINVVVSSFVMVYMYKLYSALKVTRQADVTTVAFRKWLIAFIVIGVLSAITFAFIAISGLLSVKPGY